MHKLKIETHYQRFDLRLFRFALASLMALSTLLLSAPSWASVTLMVWQGAPDAPRVILPRLENETSDQAVRRYLTSLIGNQELRGLFPEGDPAKTIGKTILMGAQYDLPDHPINGKTRLAFIANQIDDITINGARIQRNIRRFGVAGSSPYVIAISADLGLSEMEARDFGNKVARQFGLLVSLGGDDIDPALFGQEIRFANRSELNRTRDESELRLVKIFKATGLGVFFGICRGHQMGAIADGHGIHSDLTEEGIGKTDDHVNRQGQTLTEKQRWHHLLLEPSLLSRLLGGVRNMTVNSLHHQVVDPRVDAASYPVAFHETSGVEALQGRNGLSLSVQFHPEFPSEVSLNESFSSDGFKILKGIVSYARMIRQRHFTSGARCEHVFKAPLGAVAGPLSKF